MNLTTSPTFVLVPGAWQGGWAWQPVGRRLREAGYAAVTVTLPGLADGDDRAGLRLSDAIDHVVSEVERRDLAEVWRSHVPRPPAPLPGTSTQPRR